MARTKGQVRKRSRNSSHASNSSARPQFNACKESKPMTAIKYVMTFFLRLICWLDVNLCSVGENAGGMFGYLKLFGIKLGIDITELFEMSREPNCPADYLKVICYAGIVVFLCYFGLSNKTSSIAQRLSSVAVLSAIGHFFWIILSPLPFSFCVCFACVCGLLVGAASKITT